MGLSIETMRQFIANYYGKDKISWINKVKKMSDGQVLAVYTRLATRK